MTEPNDEEWAKKLIDEYVLLDRENEDSFMEEILSRLKAAREEGERSMARAILRRWGRKDLKFFIELHAADKASLKERADREEPISDSESRWCDECQDYEWRTNCNHLPKEESNG